MIKQFLSFNILFRFIISKQKSQVSARKKYREITINKLHDRESRGPCYYQTVLSIMLLHCNFPNIIMIVPNIQSPPTIYHLPQSTCQIVVPCSRSTDVKWKEVLFSLPIKQQQRFIAVPELNWLPTLRQYSRYHFNVSDKRSLLVLTKWKILSEKLVAKLIGRWEFNQWSNQSVFSFLFLFYLFLIF